MGRLKELGRFSPPAPGIPVADRTHFLLLQFRGRVQERLVEEVSRRPAPGLPQPSSASRRHQRATG